MTDLDFHKLYSHREKLRRYASRFVGDSDAEDLVAEAYLQLLSPRYTEMGKGVQFLYRCVRNGAIDRIRRRRTLSDIEDIVNPEPHYDVDLRREVLRFGVERALHVLNPQERVLVELQLDGRNIYEWGIARGYDYADIGRAYFSGFAKLREVLKS